MERNPTLKLRRARKSAKLGVTTQHVRFPLPDISIPETTEQMVGILDRIDHALTAEQPVYAHCWGGVGRTGTVIGCWLVRHGRSGAEALQELARLWEPVPKRTRKVNPKPVTPETEPQRQYVLSWKEPAASEQELTMVPTKSPTTAAPQSDLLDRCRGALLGLAVADATGAYLEFRQRGTDIDVRCQCVL